MKRPVVRRAAGDVIDVAYPFHREEIFIDESGAAKMQTWVPGAKGDARFPDSPWRADAMGQMVLTVIGTFKPNGFPERIFYTRKWRDPSGKMFGKSQLRIRSAASFTVLARGYQGEFTLRESR